MFGSAIVGVAIGLFLLFLLLSMLTTVIQEAIANLFKLRHGNLIKGIRTLLEDPAYAGLADKVYEHPLIFRLYAGAHKRTVRGRVVWTNGPAYIKAETFVAAVLDTVRRDIDPGAANQPLGLNELLGEAKSIVDRMRPGPLKTNLMLAVGDVRVDIKTVKTRLEAWFDEAMDRVSGWYRQKAQFLAITLGFATALVLNADSVHFAVRLWQDQPLREAISGDAAAVIDAVRAEAAGTGDAGVAAVDPVQVAEGSATRIRAALIRVERLPIGWLTWDEAAPPAACRSGGPPSDGPAACRRLPVLPYAFQPGQTPWTALLGWFLTAVALSLGSSFWFSILSRALQLRTTGTRIPTSSEVEAGAQSARR